MAKKTTKPVNAKVTVHIDTNATESFEVLNALSSAPQTPAVKRFAALIRAALVTGVVTTAKEM